tara:strand:+ start:54 stop:302 length:249 start_codon:yes stop_codon:yes gene_type:complete
MATKVFENIDSSAIFRIKVEDSSVFVTFQSKIDKEYEYFHKDVENFVKSVENSIKDPENSIGRYINAQIRSKGLELVENTNK